MRSKLSIFVVLLGSLFFSGYIYFDYLYHDNWITSRFSPLKEPLGVFPSLLVLSAFIGSLVAAYLINERRKLLERTKHSEQHSKRAAHEWTVTFDSMPYGVLLIDDERNIVRANKYFKEFVQMPEHETAFNKKCYNIVCKNAHPPDYCPLQRAIVTRKTETREYFHEKHNKFMNESITPITNDEGKVISYVHVLMDVSEMKEKEKRLIQSKDAFFNMLKDMDATNKEMREVYDSLITTLSNIIDAKSPWTRGHSIEVSWYAMSVARDMGLSGTDIEALKTAALLHDIGKIGTYDVILDKPGRLTDDELVLIRNHTIKGEEILKPIKGLEPILPIIRAHHERVDGAGYPDRLKGDNIPFLARILCVADAYDAMVSDRPYRPSRSRESALAEIQSCAGTQFDPLIVQAFMKITLTRETPVF
ncbi:MAG: HD domain-containing protein [Nitrospiraceae bacterium]|nr:MAG: HD domain-containing protein [Nitrospiraceae bacterium]